MTSTLRTIIPPAEIGVVRKLRRWSVAPIVGLFARQASGSFSFFRLTAVFYAAGVWRQSSGCSPDRR
ncbi:MAG: hypothetical protein J6R86_02755, partial [Lentisphaeria bacterium]|nr:hypothetical protein [Lentisphaeria bacterium]